MALSAAAHHSFDKVAAGEKFYGTTSTEDGQGRRGCAQSSTETEVQSSRGSGVLRAVSRGHRLGGGPLFSPSPGRRNGFYSALWSTIVDAVPLVPLLDDPVLQTVEQLQDVLQFFDRLTTVAEPVIEVPKILPLDVLLQRLCRDTQLAEQLVEVPTIVSYSFLQLRTVEQNVDIPVPGREGRAFGLQGFLPGQGSTAMRPSQNAFLSRLWSRSLIFLVEPFKIFRPGQSTSSSLHVPAGISGGLDEPGEGFFRTLP